LTEVGAARENGVLRVLFIMIVLLVSSGAHAAGDDDPKDLYKRGREAFERGDFQRAYDLFRRSFLLSSEPALLFNMASSLQKLGRPHDAAETLRSYLRAAPDDPERAEIERRVRSYEEQQRLLDGERPRPPPETAPPPAVTALPPAVLAPAPTEPRRSRRGLIIGLSVGGAAVVAIAVGVALGLTLGGPDYTSTPLGVHPGTR
jgi:tetratricopeptide (TPR) repeat protein